MGIGNPFKKLEKEIKKGITRLGDSTKSSINKLGFDVRSGIDRVGKEARNSIATVGDKAEDEVRTAGSHLVHELEATGKRLADDVEDVAEKAIDELEDDVKEALEAIFATMASEGLKRGVAVLEKAERIGETALTDASFSLDISAVGLEWGDIGGRITELREKVSAAARKPPKLTRAYVIQIIEALAPDRVSLSLDVKLAALVVTSDDIGVGFGFSVSTPAFLAASDEFFEAIGL